MWSFEIYKTDHYTISALQRSDVCVPRATVTKLPMYALISLFI
jgi:hypothetical protein